MPSLPKISNWAQYHTETKRLKALRGEKFCLGLQIGFGEYNNPKGTELRKILFTDPNHGITTCMVAAGVEYGELLAEAADSDFHIIAQQTYNLTYTLGVVEL